MDRLREFFGTGTRRRGVIGIIAVVFLLTVALTPVRTRILEVFALADKPGSEPTASPLPSPSSSPFDRQRGPILVFPTPTETQTPSTPRSGGKGRGGGGRKWVLAAAGDIACPASQSVGSECQQAGTARILSGLTLDAMLPLGDNQYENGTFREYQRSYDRTWGRLKGITHPVPGNHEYDGGAQGYFSYFGGLAGNPGAGFYSFDLGSWHLIALNSNCEAVGGCGHGSRQERWLRNDLAKYSKRCTLAYWHHPRFSSGSAHGSTGEVQGLWQALYDHKADVVLVGHEHNYERFAPMDAAGRSDPKGIREFVVGTGGRSHYPFGRPLPASQVRNSSTFGVLKMTLTRTSYRWKFLPENGSFTDSGRDRCH
jgi:calcineurin-like phosphoesterase family protein